MASASRLEAIAESETARVARLWKQGNATMLCDEPCIMTVLPIELHMAIMDALPCLDLVRSVRMVCRRWYDYVAYRMRHDRVCVAVQPRSDTRHESGRFGLLSKWDVDLALWLCDEPLAVDCRRVRRFAQGTGVEKGDDDERQPSTTASVGWGWTLARACLYGHVACARLPKQQRLPQMVHPCRSNDMSMARVMAVCAWMGSMSMVSALHRFGRCWSARAISAAIFQGRVSCLRYFFAHHCPDRADLCSVAARGGQPVCLAYLYVNGAYLDKGSAVCEEAALRGHLGCLRYAREKGFEWNASTCESAALGGSVSCLAYAHESGCEWDSRVCEAAAFGGHLVCLAYAHERRCPWDRFVCTSAALTGHLDCLVYARSNGCPCDLKKCAFSAVAGGQLACLRYVFFMASLAPTNPLPLHQVPSTATIAMAETIDHYGVCEVSAEYGRLRCLRYANNVAFSSCAAKTVAQLASKRGYIQCLQYAYANGCPMDQLTYQHASLGCHLDCLVHCVTHMRTNKEPFVS